MSLKRGYFAAALLGSAWVMPVLAADADADSAADRDEILVLGQQMKAAPNAGKSDIPLIETPQAITIISTEQLKTRGVVRLAEALRGVAGVSRSSTYGYYDAYQIRGFDAAYGSVYLDGLISQTVAGSNNELAGLEQIEVVKGPASMLFGSAPLGGIINLVSKRPRDDDFVDLGLATGSYNLAEGTVDANMRLDAAGTLLARLNLVYRDSNDFVRFSDKNRIHVAPALTWKMDEDTELTLLTRYERNHDAPWSPVSAWGTVLPSVNGKLPIDFAINGRDPKAIHDQRYYHLGYAFRHSFSDTLSFDQTLRYADRKVYWNDWIFWSGFVDGAIVDGVQQGHIAGRYVYGPFHQRDKDFSTDAHLSWKVDTGPVSHDIVVGVDHRRNSSRFGEDGGNYDPAANPLDLLNPDYDQPLIHDPAAAYADSGKSKQTGLYIQDHLRFGERATLTIGSRYDWADSEGGVKDRKFSPRVGATYAILPGASVYASWSKSFTPQAGYFTVAGDPLPPETGRNIETGIKVQTPDSRLTGMVSIFELERQNVATEDPANPFFYVVSGEQRSRGIEVEAAWRPTPAWTLSIAYAYLDAKITKDNLLPVGARLQNVPKHGLNLFGEYIVPEGPLTGLGLNLAFQYNSRKVGANFPRISTVTACPIRSRRSPSPATRWSMPASPTASARGACASTSTTSSTSVISPTPAAPTA
jgi:iron complex outermembrane receptor protein